MKITFFDIDSIGTDLDLTPITSLGECEIYPNSTPAELIERIGDTEVAVINKMKMTKEVLDSAPNLKLILVAATGFDNIDTAYCRERGIAVCNVPGYSTDSVALVTVTLVLSLAMRLKTYENFVVSGEYSASGVANRLSPAFNDLSGKTWGIVGYGNIGRKIGEVARAFGCRVIFNKNTPVDDESYRDIDALCRESDIITLNCPLNDKTRNLINAERIGLMKKNVILVNTARGAVCDEQAVADAVKSGKIASFGCDVYSTEPFLENHPFWEIKDLSNVCLTPHMAWSSFEARTRVIYEMSVNIKAFYCGKIRNRVEI